MVKPYASRIPRVYRVDKVCRHAMSCQTGTKYKLSPLRHRDKKGYVHSRHGYSVQLPRTTLNIKHGPHPPESTMVEVFASSRNR